MAGCKSLSDEEVQKIKNSFVRQRDRTLFVLGIRTGWRISQLLSIQLKHFIQHGQVSKTLKIDRTATKGQKTSQECALHSEAITELTKLVKDQYGNNFNSLNPDLYLFKSRKGINSPIKRAHVHNILKAIVNCLQLDGKIASHSMRKTLSQRIYKNSGNDLLITQKALNHSYISSTINYLDVNQKEVDKLILDME